MSYIWEVALKGHVHGYGPDESHFFWLRMENEFDKNKYIRGPNAQEHIFSYVISID